jgi:hypothetical protein
MQRSVAGGLRLFQAVSELEFYEDERLGPPVQNTMNSKVRFRAELSEYGVERLEMARA